MLFSWLSSKKEINSTEFEKLFIAIKERDLEIAALKANIKTLEMQMSMLHDKVLKKIRSQIPKEEEVTDTEKNKNSDYFDFLRT